MKKIIIMVLCCVFLIDTLNIHASSPYSVDPDTPGITEPLHRTDKFKLQQEWWQCGMYMVHNMIYYNTHNEVSISTLKNQLHTSTTGSGTDANNVAGVLNLYDATYTKRSCINISIFKTQVKNTLNAHRSVGFNVDMHDLYGSQYIDGTGHYLMAYGYSGENLYCYDSWGRGFITISFQDMYNGTNGMHGFYYTK